MATGGMESSRGHQWGSPLCGEEPPRLSLVLLRRPTSVVLLRRLSSPLPAEHEERRELKELPSPATCHQGKCGDECMARVA